MKNLESVFEIRRGFWFYSAEERKKREGRELFSALLLPFSFGFIPTDSSDPHQKQKVNFLSHFSECLPGDCCLFPQCDWWCYYPAKDQTQVKRGKFFGRRIGFGWRVQSLMRVSMSFALDTVERWKTTIWLKVGFNNRSVFKCKGGLYYTAIESRENTLV